MRSSRYFSKKVSVAVSAELWYMFVLQGSERMKHKLLKDLYDYFLIPHLNSQLRNRKLRNVIKH